MRSMNQAIRRPLLAAVLASVWIAGGLLAPARGDAPPWQAARSLYETAMSSYRAKNYAQAEPLFENFIRRYRGNENLPDAYLYLASCKGRLGKGEEAADLREMVIRRFTGGAHWFNVYRGKILGNRKDPNVMLENLAAFARHMKYLPVEFSGRIYHRDHHRTEAADWHPTHRARRIPRDLHWLRPIIYEHDWEQQLIDAVQTPEHAQQMLKIMHSTFRLRGDSLPPHWKVFHLRLLKKAGEDPEAVDKQLQQYANAVKDTPMELGLWAEWARGLNDYADPEKKKTQRDPEAAMKVYKMLTDRFSGWASLSHFIGPYQEYLRKKGDYDEYVAFVEWYVDTYPEGHLRGECERDLMSMLRTAAVNGDPVAQKKLLERVDKRYGKSGDSRDRYLMDYYIDLKQFDKAAEHGTYMLKDNNWSGGMANKIEQYAGRYDAFKPLWEQAQKKYGLVLENDPKAAELLTELKQRAKDEQVRHMEEIGKELYTKHKGTREALDGVKLLSDYYLKKVLIEKRDEWMDRMIQGWPRHPELESALHSYTRALDAGKQYKRLGQILDIIKERFHGNHGRVHRGWWKQRMKAYQALKDEQGVRKLWNQRLDGWRRRAGWGDINAMDELRHHDPKLRGDTVTTKQIGDFWMQYANKFKGTRVEMACLRKAKQDYYDNPLRSRGKREVMFSQALDCINRLRTQKSDPEVAWNMAYADINLLVDFSRHSGGGEKHFVQALGLLDKRIGQEKDYITARLNMGSLAAATEDYKKHGKRVLAIMDRLDRMGFGTAGFMANLHRQMGNYAQAQKMYTRFAANAACAYHGYGSIRAALSCAERQGGRAYLSALEGFRREIGEWQNVMPGWYADVGEHLLRRKDRAALKVRNILATRYRSSGPRGEFEAEIEKMMKSKRK